MTDQDDVVAARQWLEMGRTGDDGTLADGFRASQRLLAVAVDALRFIAQADQGFPAIRARAALLEIGDK